MSNANQSPEPAEAAKQLVEGVHAVTSATSFLMTALESLSAGCDNLVGALGLKELKAGPKRRRRRAVRPPARPKGHVSDVDRQRARALLERAGVYSCGGSHDKT